MNVLIAYITPSDPWPEEVGRKGGPAGAVTVAKAFLPEAVYLLHTNDTFKNMDSTRKCIEEEVAPKPKVIHEGFKLDLPDPTDYHRLTDLIPPVLRKIGKENPGRNFYLVSGVPQVRIIFALCLSSSVLNGALLEVNRLNKGEKAWPSKPEEYRKRIKALDLKVISNFRDLAREKSEAIRLRLNLALQEAYLDSDRRIDIRSRSGSRGGSGQPRSFRMLVMLAAHMCYGEEGGIVSKAMLERHIYNDTESPGVNIPTAVKAINNQAGKLTSKASIPLKNMIISTQGTYRLCEELKPGDEKIVFKGDLAEYLMKTMEFKRNDLKETFPRLMVS